MDNNKLKEENHQEVFSSPVDINFLITSIFFLIKMCEDLQPMELRKDYAIMKKIANQPEKLSKDEILYAEKCMDKCDKIFKKFQRKINEYRSMTEIFRWLEKRNRNQIKEDNEVTS